MEYKKNWDLSQILNQSGRSLEETEKSLIALSEKVKNFSTTLPDCIAPFEDLYSEIREAAALVCCYAAIDTTNTKATSLEMLLTEVLSEFSDLELQLGENLKNAGEPDLAGWTQEREELLFPLMERRQIASEKLPLDKESLINSLSVPGFHSMSTLYYTYIGSLSFPLDGKKLNISQIESKLDVTDRETRKNAFHSMETTLKEGEPIFAQILNNIIGYRLKVYEKRGYKTFLHETLRDNRITKKSIMAMWEAVSGFKEPLRRYMDAKAKLLGLEKLAYYDLSAPIASEETKPVTWEDSCRLIIDLFGKLSENMANFTKRALSESWIDAAVSAKKRAGGFCVDIPLLKESRILMSFQDSLSDQGTLAHELGHAYHNEILFKRSPLLQDLPMCLAETASTMCEVIVGDNAIKQAKTKQEQILLLDDKISRAAAFFMDLHSRFILDTALHEKRKKGFITPSEMAEMTVEAQKKGFANHLSEYFPHFFCYKMHFYFTDASFYNWSYTFGYLLSLCLYESLQSGDFSSRYDHFLLDTGAMTVEDLIKKHLGSDPSDPSFYAGALSRIEKDIDIFVKLSE